MHNLYQLVYASKATTEVTRDELINLLRVARKRNAESGITGVLLYADNSFFQVLEGNYDSVKRLMNSISRDSRHSNITRIINEPIAARSFSKWSMGLAEISGAELKLILEANPLPHQNKSFAGLEESRARKLLDAFKEGRWRAKISQEEWGKTTEIRFEVKEVFPPTSTARPHNDKSYSYAFQPIVNDETGRIFSYEALVRGAHNTSAKEVLQNIPADELHAFDQESRLLAMHWAAHLGICTHLNLNIMPSAILSSPTSVLSVLEKAAQLNLQPRQIVLEVLESGLIDDLDRLCALLRNYRSSGMLFAIDDFGAGHAGLNLLAEFQPDLLKLDLQLIRNIDRNGPRQAIIRGIRRSCIDLGIEIIAEGVESKDEYKWLRDEGITLFQGYLFARPAFEELQKSFSTAQ